MVKSQTLFCEICRLYKLLHKGSRFGFYTLMANLECRVKYTVTSGSVLAGPDNDSIVEI